MRTAMSLLLVAMALNTTVNAETGLRSPHFRVTNGSVDDLPLLMTSVDVQVSGVIAEVRMTQVYKNDGEQTLESVYLVPTSEDAAVHGLTLTVGDRRLEAQIQEKTRARGIYEQAREEGQTTSLLEQFDPRLMRMNVANILPGDDILVELVYTQRLRSEGGLYTFRLPASARPSALTTGGNTGAFAVATRDSHPVGFDLVLRLEGGMPISELDSPSHQIEVSAKGRSGMLVELAESELFAGDRDFELNYRLGGDAVRSGLITFVDGDDGYFLLLAEPPARVTAKNTLPREYIFVVDISGSMQGFPVETARLLTLQMLERLGPLDRFNIILFSGSSKLLHSESVPNTPQWRLAARELVDMQSAGGGTALLPALQQIHRIPRSEGLVRTALVITDGGIGLPLETLQFVRQGLADMNLFVFGVGRENGIDRAVVDRLARAGRGESLRVDQSDQAYERTERMIRYIERPLLSNIRIDVEGAQAFDIEPAVLPDLFAERAVFAVGRFQGEPQGSIQVSGRTADGSYQAHFALESAETGGAGIRYLWARERLRWLEDLEAAGDDVRSEILALGLNHGLLSRHTSFVAVDQLVRAAGEPTPVSLNRSISTTSARISSVLVSGHGFSPGLALQLKGGLTALSSAHLRPAAPPPPALERRPSITFVLGQDRGTNRFHQAAADYFRSTAKDRTDQVVVGVASLEAVRSELSDRIDQGQTWGVINLVVHGSPWTGLRTSAHTDHDATLSGLSESLPVVPLDPGLIDTASEIRVWGCGVGQSRTILALVGHYFASEAGRPAVRAPRHFVHFDEFGAHQQPVWWALAPASACKGRFDAGRAFDLAFPDGPIRWDRRLGQVENCRADGLEADPVVVTVELDAPVSGRQRAYRLAHRLPGVAVQLELLGAEVSDLDWSLTDGRLVGRATMLRFHSDNEFESPRLPVDFRNPLLTGSVGGEPVTAEGQQ